MPQSHVSVACRPCSFHLVGPASEEKEKGPQEAVLSGTKAVYQ